MSYEIISIKVIESPDDEDSLLGAPLKDGFDSHYTLVKKKIENSQVNFLPCKMDDPTGPDFDEMVVFDPDQILPRYLCYYSHNESDASNIFVIW